MRRPQTFERSRHISLDTLVSQARQHEGEAAGDAAGDLFGLDIGF